MSTSIKFNLRLPPELHQQATETAQRMGISLNAFTLLALRNWTDYQTGKIGQARRAPAPARALATKARPPANWPKVGRNEPCPCDSGQKYKHCHGTNR